MTITYQNDTATTHPAFSNATIVLVDGDRRGVVAFDNSTATYHYTIDPEARVDSAYSGHGFESFLDAQDSLVANSAAPTPAPSSSTGAEMEAAGYFHADGLCAI
jgi:hypothetical protein